MRLKKIFAGLTAAAAMLGGLALGATTANAAGSKVEDTATFTFTADSTAQLTGRTVAVYKIGDYLRYGSDDAAYGVQSTVANGAVVGAAIRSVFADDDSVTLPAEGVDTLSWALQKGLFDQSTTRPWASGTTRRLATALPQPGVTLDAVTGSPITLNAAENATSVSVTLEAGIYLFVDQTAATGEITQAVPMIVASGTVESGAVTSPTAEVTVNFKNSSNTESFKKVDETSASIGDTLHYTLTGKVANPAPVSFKFTDKPGVGQTIDAGSFSATVDGAEVAFANYFTVDLNDLADNKADGVNAFTVTLNTGRLAEAAGKDIVVEFTATVNSEADAGEGVSNWLQKNNGGYDQTPDTNVKLFEFSFTKIDADKMGLAGATFDLSVAEGQTGHLPTVGTNATSGADGTVTFTGLKAGTYTVTETKVADGYQDFKAAFTVSIDEATGEATFSTTAVSDPYGLVSTGDETVLNVKSVTQLPLTGAAGTALFTIIGVLLAGAAAIVFAKSRNAKRALHM